MEVIEYETPTSWDDKGMNWNTPDPTNADYVMAIRQAILEKCAALHWPVGGGVFDISPAKAVSRKMVAALISTIRQLAGRFVNVSWEDYKEDFSDFPRMWTYGDIIQERNCRMYEYAKFGLLTENGGLWLKQIKTALDKLTVIKASQVYGKSVMRYGAEHDPPFSESIGTAMQEAFDGETWSKHNTSFPTQVYGWSGNTHWKCPKPDWEGDPEDNKDGYCGYASSLAYRLKGVRSWLKDAQFDLFAGVIVTAPTGAVDYSQVLDQSILDTGSTGFRKGLNWTKKVRVKDPCNVDFVLGDADAIPKNEAVPSSEFDKDGNAVTRHSTKKGWVGKTWGFIDYGVDGGFKFRAKEDS